MKAVLKETLRVKPAAIANSRMLDKTIELNGYEVPAGCTIIPFHYFMMNR